MKNIDLLFDTDIGADCDDVMALAYLVYAKRNFGINIRAISVSNGCEYGASAISAFFEDLGEEIPPLASPAGEVKTYDGYCKLLAERFGAKKEPITPENAVKVMRKALVCSENAVICAVGAFTNVAALLESKPDEISELDGASLVAKKCSKIVLMAGIFDENSTRVEWNVHLDVRATQSVVKLCPTPLYFLPSETGINILTGAPAIAKYGDTTPLSASFLSRRDVRETGTRPSWDPATAVFAIEGCRDFLVESESGVISVDDTGKTSFKPSPCGAHRVIYLKGMGTELEKLYQKLAAEYIDNCALEIYGDRGLN